MKILHFEGEGTRMMKGIQEYIVILDGKMRPDGDCAPGFELKSSTEVGTLPSSLPLNTVLIPSL